ncbi:NADPH-dependent F420 reductase [Halobacteriales archaeon QH_6_64_20]|jgi:NADPH-dependent F420 reductase|nr:MAG: NADPH-dependent F420 reductase [Halobacteriales archaeon QH_6_64_20]
MRIALCGGTGDIGEGLALRWARDTDHDLLVGSRDPEKARAAVERYEEELDARGITSSIAGFANGMAADRADVVLACVPAYHLVDTIEAVADRLDDTILVSPAVGMQREEGGFQYNRPSAGSVTALAASAAPEDVPVVGAFHSLAAGRLADLGTEIDADTLVVGDSEEAKTTVADLAEGIDGLRALDAGPIANAAPVESLTPLLINLAQYNYELSDVGVRFE